MFDLSLVDGVDMSSTETFVGIHRPLAAKRDILAFCGFTSNWRPLGKRCGACRFFVWRE